MRFRRIEVFLRDSQLSFASYVAKTVSDEEEEEEEEEEKSRAEQVAHLQFGILKHCDLLRLVPLTLHRLGVVPEYRLDRRVFVGDPVSPLAEQVQTPEPRPWKSVKSQENVRELRVRLPYLLQAHRATPSG